MNYYILMSKPTIDKTLAVEALTSMGATVHKPWEGVHILQTVTSPEPLESHPNYEKLIHLLKSLSVRLGHFEDQPTTA